MKGDRPWLIREQGSFSKEVSFEEQVYPLAAFLRLLRHNSLPLFYNVKLIPNVSLQQGSILIGWVPAIQRQN